MALPGVQSCRGNPPRQLTTLMEGASPMQSGTGTPTSSQCCGKLDGDKVRGVVGGSSECEGACRPCFNRTCTSQYNMSCPIFTKVNMKSQATTAKLEFMCNSEFLRQDHVIKNTGSLYADEMYMTSVSWVIPALDHQSEKEVVQTTPTTPSINTCRPMSHQEEGAKVSIPLRSINSHTTAIRSKN